MKQSKRKNTQKTGPRKKQKQVKEGDIVITLHEQFDIVTLSSIYQLNLKHKEDEQVRTLLTKFSVSATKPYPSSGQQVEYAYGKKKDKEAGRLFANKVSIQPLKKWIFRLCCHKYYDSIDIENCAPNIFRQLLQKHLNECPEIILKYTKDRNDLYKEARKQVPSLEFVPDKSLKQTFLLGLTGGRHTNHFDLLNLPPDHIPIPVFTEWEKTIRKYQKKLKKLECFRNVVKEVEDLDDTKNVLGKITSRIIFNNESEIVLCLVSFFKRKQIEVAALKFDEVIVNKNKLLTRDMIIRAEEHIERTCGFKVNLKHDTLNPTKEDVDHFWGERCLHKIKGKFEQQVYLLYRNAQMNHFKRLHDNVMRPHKTIPGVYVEYEKSNDYINRVLKNNYGGTFRMNPLDEWFCQVDHPKFELLTYSKMNKSVISFQNGYLNIETMDFELWSDVETPPLTDHYFDVKIDLVEEKLNGPTPLWDKMLLAQMTPEVKDMFEVLIGRLFYPIGKYDNWQVAPFLKGDANTGKSTICDIAKEMFPKHTIGCVTATQEKTFGLEALKEKRVVIIPDLPPNFSQLVCQSDFQSMISGEPVSIARKNKIAIAGSNWTAPLLAAANYLPDYKDKSGSVSRRLIVFLFENLISARDTKLKDKIKSNELVTIMIRCLVKYRMKCDEVDEKDFWECVPNELKNLQTKVKERTSYLANFIANGDNYYQVIFKKGHTTTMEDLDKAYSNHMRFTHKIEKAKLGDDHYPIKNAGFTVKTRNLCKTCHQHCLKVTCGDHYNSKNRYKREYIENMQLVSKKTESNIFKYD